MGNILPGFPQTQASRVVPSTHKARVEYRPCRRPDGSERTTCHPDRTPPDDAIRHKVLRPNPSRVHRSHRRRSPLHLSPQQFGVIQEVAILVAFQKKAQDPDRVWFGRRTASAPRHSHPSAAREDCPRQTNAPAVDQKPLAAACAGDPLPRPWMRRSAGLPARDEMRIPLSRISCVRNYPGFVSAPGRDPRVISPV